MVAAGRVVVKQASQVPLIQARPSPQVCVCARACVREREGGVVRVRVCVRESEGERVCTCVRVYVFVVCPPLVGFRDRHLPPDPYR